MDLTLWFPREEVSAVRVFLVKREAVWTESHE
jgi:hypothetical protein